MNIRTASRADSDTLAMLISEANKDVATPVRHARAASIHTISICVIGEHAELQRWYRGLGFIDGETKHFPHLPFSVKYMACAVPD